MKTYNGMTKMEMVKKIVAVMVAEFEEKNAKAGKKVYNAGARLFQRFYAILLFRNS